MMAPHFFMLYFVTAVLLPSLHAWSSLAPPAGNSLSIQTKASNGVQFYRCVDGDWLLESAHATLVDFYNPSKVVGNYSWVKTPSIPRYAGTWFLFNSAGDLTESGYLGSLVAGKEVMTAQATSPRDLPDFLALASNHEYGGAASLVSYIGRMKTEGGVPLEDGDCEYEDKVIELSFDTEFHFWKQDLVPPNAPAPLAVVSDRAIQGVFAQGIITYVFNGVLWMQKGTTAQLYDVPGGNKVGTYFIRETTDYRGGSFCWQFDDPNGFEIIGKHASNPILVTPGCLPWSLNVVTTSTQKSATFGEYSYVQMVSTTGGLAPIISSAGVPKLGQVYRSSFTAIYWFYCKGTY